MLITIRELILVFYHLSTSLLLRSPSNHSHCNDNMTLMAVLRAVAWADKSKQAVMPPVNLLYRASVSVSAHQVIKPRHFVRFISQQEGMTDSYACTKKGTNSIFISKSFPFSPSLDCLVKEYMCLTRFRNTQEYFIILWKNTAWLTDHVRSIITTGHQNHVLPWCKRYESLVTVFTLSSEPDAWKTNVSPVC